MAGLKIEKITRDIEDFDCGVKSINEYVSEAYYALLAQIAYTYSVVYRDKVVGFYMIMFGQVNLGKFPGRCIRACAVRHKGWEDISCAY